MIRSNAPLAASIEGASRVVVRVARALHRAGFVAGTAGNVSVRLPGDFVLVTRTGLPKARLTRRDLVVVDLGGRVVRARAGFGPTSETPMHLEVYRRRPDVHAVVHAHPVHAVALSLVGDDLAECILPEAVATLGRIALTEYSPPSSPENAVAIADAIQWHDAIVLRRHGSLTVGRTLDEAYERLEVLEHTARVLAVARTLGPLSPLDAEQVQDLRERGRAYGRAATAARGE